MEKSTKLEVLYLLEDKLKLIRDDQYSCRCPLCGDSATNMNKKRFYIKFNLDEDRPIEYNCFNCQENGYLKASVLRAFGVNSLHLGGRINAYAKRHEKKDPKKYSMKKLDYTVPLYSDSKIISPKKHYIEDRLGISFSYEELRDLKAVMDFSSFIKHNKIDKIHIKKSLAREFEYKYMGFLTTLNDTIIYRNITDDPKFKHNKYVIEPERKSNRFYTIPSMVNLFSRDEIVINIAEGVYDILGVYYHINDKNKYNQIYAAVTSSSYASILDYYFNMGVFGNVTVNIFSDRDKSIRYHKKKSIKDIEPWVKNINIIYNAKDKDMGVRKDKIELEVYSI